MKRTYTLTVSLTEDDNTDELDPLIVHELNTVANRIETMIRGSVDITSTMNTRRGTS